LPRFTATAPSPPGAPTTPRLTTIRANRYTTPPASLPASMRATAASAIPCVPSGATTPPTMTPPRICPMRVATSTTSWRWGPATR